MATMEVSAVQRYVRRTPRKARLVADSVKGMKVSEALAYLEFSPKHAARDVAKAIKSAAANAEHNFNLNRDDLVLKQLLIDEGPTYRRRRPFNIDRASKHGRPPICPPVRWPGNPATWHHRHFGLKSAPNHRHFRAG